MTDKAPPFPTSTVGRIPTVIVNVRLPKEFPLRLLAAMFARAGRLKWVRRGKQRAASDD
jgi:hypothetical protein